MNLNEALNHSANIKKLASELNNAIQLAVKDGAFIDIDIGTLQQIGENPTPFVDVSILVNPFDLE